MWVGPGGIITTFPNGGEKLCAGCEYWCGGRDVTNLGTTATCRNNNSAICSMTNKETLPSFSCHKFVKWSRIK